MTSGRPPSTRGSPASSATPSPRCTSCHYPIVQGEHISVDKNVCFLCHFKGIAQGQAPGGCPGGPGTPTRTVGHGGGPGSPPPPPPAPPHLKRDQMPQGPREDPPRGGRAGQDVRGPVRQLPQAAAQLPEGDVHGGGGPRGCRHSVEDVLGPGVLGRGAHEGGRGAGGRRA